MTTTEIAGVAMPTAMPHYLVLSTGVAGFTVEAVASDRTVATAKFESVRAAYVRDGMIGSDEPYYESTRCEDPVLCDTLSPEAGAISAFGFRVWLLDLRRASGVSFAEQSHN